MLIYGIDPGFTGAIALYWPDAGKIEVHDMPVMKNPKGKTIINPHGVLDILANEGSGKSLAVIEQVGAMPGQGVSSMFRFGQGLGVVEACAAASKLPLQYVTPAKWKKHFNLTRNKGVSRGLAMQRFPDYASEFSRAKDDGRAEAVLIALYAAETMT